MFHQRQRILIRPVRRAETGHRYAHDVFAGQAQSVKRLHGN